MSDGLREVNVNGVRFFRADDVERWHRGNVAKAEEWDDLSERVGRLDEFLKQTVAKYRLRMPDEWVVQAEALLS